jgi:hypothetical protein
VYIGACFIQYNYGQIVPVDLAIYRHMGLSSPNKLNGGVLITYAIILNIGIATKFSHLVV